MAGWKAALSPDGQVLAVANYDLTVGLWSTSDLSHPRRLGTLPPPGDAPGQFMAFSHDGSMLLVGGERTSALWDVHNISHPELVRSMPCDLAAFSPRRPLLATRDTDNGTVQLWDVSRRNRPTALSVLSGRVVDGDLLVFSPDGQTLATGGADHEQVWLSDITDPRHPYALDENLNQQVSAPGGTRADAVAYSPDGRLLAVIGPSGIQLWNTTVPESPRRLGQPLSSRSQVQGETAMAFGPDGQSLIVEDTQTLRVWRLPPVMLLDCGDLTPAGFSSDARTLATTCGDETIQLWDTSTPDAPEHVGGGLPGWAAVFAPRGHLLAVAAPDGGVRLYDATVPSHLRRLGRLPAVRGYDVGAMAFGPNGRTLTMYEEPGAESQDKHQRTLQDDGIRTRTWDITAPSRPHPVGPSVLLEKETDVADSTLSPDGSLLATNVGGDSIHLWDTSIPTHPVRRGPALHGTVAAFSLNGHYLAVGSQQGTIRLRNTTRAAQPTLLGSPAQADGAVDGAAFSPDSRSLAIRTSEGEIQLWDTADPVHPAAKGHSFAGQASSVESLLFSPDGQTLATGGEDGVIRLWALDAGRATRRVCAVTAHTLTKSEWRRYVGNLPYHPPCP